MTVPTFTTVSSDVSRSSSSGSSQSRFDVPFSWSLPPNTRITRYYWTFDIPTTSGYYSTWSCYYDQAVKWGRRSTAGGVTFDVTGSYSGSSGTARIMLGVSGKGKTNFTGVRFCADYEYTATASTWSLTKSSVAADGTSTIGVNISKATSGATHKVTYDFGKLSSSYSLAAGTNSHSITVPLSWCAQIPNAASGTGAVTVETIYNGSVIGSETKYFTVTVPASVTPSIGGFTVTGNNLKWNLYLAGISTATLKMTGVAGAQGSAITRYRIEGGGFAADAASLTTGTLSAGTLTFTATVWDSRGRTARKTLSVTVQAYQKPSITSAKTSRCNASGTVSESGTYLRAVCSYSWTSVGSNARTLRIEYRPSGTSAWTSAYSGTPESGAAQVLGGGGISVQQSYEVRYTLSDSIASTTAISKVPTGYVYMRWDPPNNRFGFGCYPEGSNRLQIADGWDIYHKGRMLTGSTKIPAGADLNAYETPGMYYNDYNKDVATMANAPTGNAFALLVEKHAGVKQTLTQYVTNNPRTWVRNRYSSTWGPWVEQLDKLNWLNMVYPVGTLYMSTSSTSPASLFGGTWTQIKDTFLLSAGDKYGAGSRGGETYHNHSMTSGSADIMVMSGYLYYNESKTSFTGNYKHSGISTGTKGSYSVSAGTTLRGNTSGVNHLPPYYAVYMWRRTGYEFRRCGGESRAFRSPSTLLRVVSFEVNFTC